MRQRPTIPASAIVRSRPAAISDGRSDLEVGFAEILRRAGLPDPVTQYHFAWCCEHRKRDHVRKVAHKGERGCRACYDGWPHHWCDRCSAGACWRHEFEHDRNWALDFAWPELRLAAEVEGGIFTDGAHGSITGILRDIAKYNEAQIRGWSIIRITPKDLTKQGEGELVELITRAMAMSERRR